MAETGASCLALLFLACTASGLNINITQEFRDYRWSFEVSLDYYSGEALQESFNFQCEASMITSKLALTVKNCPHLIESAPENWIVQAGDRKSVSKRDVRLNFDLDSNLFSYSVQEISVPFATDAVVLVKLETGFPISTEATQIDPIPLPRSTDTAWPDTSTECLLQGRDCTDEDGGPMAQNVQVLDVSVLPGKDCETDFLVLGDKDICTSIGNANNVICKVNIGSPMVCNDGGTWRLGGMAKQMSLTSNQNRPTIGVYTRVPLLTDEINLAA